MAVLMRPMLFRQENAKLLRYLGGTKNLEFRKVIHTRFIVSYRDNIPETNARIDLYSKCEALASMSGHFQNGSAFEVVRLFKSMVSDHDESCLPNGYYVSGLVVSSCINVGYLLLGRQCHGYLLKSGLVFNEYVKTALVRLYSMLSDVVGAMEVLLLDTCSYNLMFVGFVDKGYLDEALIILRRKLGAEDMVWNKATYIGIFGLCARLLDADLGRQVHNKLLKSDVELDESVCSSMIYMYGKCQEILSARKVFDRFVSRNVVTWTAMLAAYSEHGLLEESLILFSEMQLEDVAPNESTLSELLTVSAKLVSMRCGNLFHALAVKTGFRSHKNVEDTLIDMYSRTGNIEAAEKVFLGMTYRDIVTWNTMICGYLHHGGYGNKSLALFQEMLRLGEDPNYATFVGVLGACGQVGLVEQGLYYLYEFMKQKGVEPGLEHYMWIINMLIKAGKLNEALSFIVSTPSKWDVFAWTALLSGCQAHRNHTLGIRVAELIPDDMATKVSKWCGVTQVRELMEIIRDEKEECGRSWVEIEDETYAFASVYKGDPKFVVLHQVMKQFLASVKLFFDIRTDTDVEDLMKSDCDGYLSEELAVAYALWKTHDMAPICIIKTSGKISHGCHTLMKLISKATARSIMVRDAHFFHNFQDGLLFLCRLLVIPNLQASLLQLVSLNLILTNYWFS